MTNTITTYSSPENTAVTHGINVNSGITIPSIPVVAGALGGSVALFNVPFNLITMLTIVFGTFFGPMIMGMLDHNYAYSQTVAKVTNSQYRRLAKDKYHKLKNAVKSGKQVRIPLNEITGDSSHEKDVLVINGRNFSVEGPSNFSSSIKWDETLESTAQVYGLENQSASQR